MLRALPLRPFIVVSLLIGSAAPGAETLRFNRDIRPILSDNCFQCHGPDARQRKADLRLDQREAAIAERKGIRAIVPGRPEASEMHRRLITPNADERMPPEETGRKLTALEIATLERWIREGARYEAHWAFIPPVRPALPEVKRRGWARNPIDRFILARLEREGFGPSEETDRATLIRRVTLDLTGLPPALAELDDFSRDDSAQAYETLVERLLASDNYGEHLAAPWLDAARYADSNGYNNDTPRYNWRWRDWVIQAFNRNLSYDRFITEQLAGDLLPGATLDQRIATGFNRNHNITSEGGIIDEEYRLEYVADRVHTVSTVFMALSMQCARCHDHKFDPVTQKEYYQFFAFFNQVPEHGYHAEHVGNVKPVLPAPTFLQQENQKRLQGRIAGIKDKIEQRKQAAETVLPEWERGLSGTARQTPSLPSGSVLYLPFDGALERGKIEGTPQWVEGKINQALRFDGNTHVELGDAVNFERDEPFSYGAWVQPSAEKSMNILSRMDSNHGYRGFDLTFEGGPISVHLIHESPGHELKVQTKQAIARGEWTHVFATYDGSSKAAGVRIYFDGKAQDLEVQHDSLDGTIRAEVGARIGRRTPTHPFEGAIDEVRFHNRMLTAAEVATVSGHDPIPGILGLPSEARTPEQRGLLRDYYLARFDSVYGELSAALIQAEEQLGALDKVIPTAMVMRDLEKPRDTFMLQRGQYDKPTDRVVCGTPAALGGLPDNAPQNRLGLAQWLTRPEHPLTARVMVNKLWHQVFGRGLVETLDDFGSQGAWPSHPDLLDWLAVEFVESGWDIKHVLQLMVTSATYRQSNRIDERKLELDPGNLLLSRAPRFRLTAEAIRDQALALSGLLYNRLGGPSVRPYQPAGLWEEVIVADDSYSGGGYKQDHGPALYRRSLYTWWKRTCPPPMLNTFDAPEREFCTVRRSRTNTPLQALALLNDPTFVEAARALAERVLTTASQDAPSRLRLAFRLVTARFPAKTEMEVLQRTLAQQSARFRADPDGARELVAAGDSEPNVELAPAELAAWTVVASTLLNLDETITKP